MELHDIREMAAHELERMYSAHQQFTQALPRLQKMASLPFLNECFQDQLDQAEAQSERFEELFNQLGVEAKSSDDQTMHHILAEIDEVEVDKSSPAVVDAKLIDVGRKANLYLEASYGTLSDIAEQMRLPHFGEMLHDRLHETDRAAEKLLNAVPEVVFV